MNVRVLDVEGVTLTEFAIPRFTDCLRVAVPPRMTRIADFDETGALADFTFNAYYEQTADDGTLIYRARKVFRV